MLTRTGVRNARQGVLCWRNSRLVDRKVDGSLSYKSSKLDDLRRRSKDTGTDEEGTVVNG